jgi:hypothetical protein
MSARPNENDALLHAPLPKLTTSCYYLPRNRAALRCVACNCRVTLGGCSGRSALTGRIWCLECADYPRQLVLNFGRRDQ